MAAVTQVVTKNAAVLGVAMGLALIGCSSGIGAGSGSAGGGGPGGGNCPTQATANAQYGSGWQTNAAFGGMAIYYPRDSQSFGGVVVVPGFISPIAMLASWGPFFATKGMAAFLVDPPTPLDQPADRAGAQVAALKSFRNEATRQGSPIAGKLDLQKLGVAGWSMGGGGTLLTAASNPEGVKAAVGWAPWNLLPGGAATRTPTMILTGGNGDALVSASMSYAQYQSIPASTPKAYYEWTTDHFQWTGPGAVGGRGGTLTWAWFHGFIDGVEECKAVAKAGGQGTTRFNAAGF
jgi:triacylglycerol lipase